MLACMSQLSNFNTQVTASMTDLLNDEQEQIVRMEMAAQACSELAIGEFARKVGFDDTIRAELLGTESTEQLALA